MVKTAALISLCLFSSAFAVAQSCVYGQAVVNVNSFIKAAPGAQVWVCPKGAGGVAPCSPLSPLVNINGASINNPVTADQNGNYSFCTNTPNKYMVQIGGAGFITSVQDGTIVPNDPQNLVITSLTVSGNITATGIVTGVNISWKTPMDFGAKGDAVQINDIAITSGTKIATSASAPFNCLTDVGKFMVIAGAGTSSARALVSPIASCQSTSQVTLTDNAGTTVTPATFPTLAYFGTNDQPAIFSCTLGAFQAGGTCYLNDNKLFMVSGTGTTMSFGSLPGIKGATLEGFGTVVYAPYGTLTSGVNDRWIFLQSGRNTPCQIAAGAIAKGATSFVVSVAGCVSAWKKGDTILVHEKDAGIGDIVYVDIATVSSIAGTTVNLVSPLSVAFPNARAFNNSGVPAACFPATPCGLSVEKLTNIIQDFTMQNFGLIVPNITDGTNTASGIVTTATKRLGVRNITCQVAGQNCFASYLDTALSFQGNFITSAVQNEFASLISPNISNNQFNTETIGSGALFNYSLINGGGMNVDLGTGFASITGNNFGSAASSVCFSVNYGVHDSSFIGNTCKFGTTAAPAINFNGGYKNTVVGNTLGGSIGGSSGIQFTDTTTGTVNILSDRNQASSNNIDPTYATPYVLNGVNTTDEAVAFDDRQGEALTIYKYGTNWSIGGSQATNFLVADSGGPKFMLHNGLGQANLSTTWGFSIGSTVSAAPGGDTCLSRNAAGVWQFGTACNNALGSWLATNATLSGSLKFTNLFLSATAPTLAAAGCGGSAASIVAHNGPGSFEVNVGTAPVAGGCTITLPSATTGWNCDCSDLTTTSTTVFYCKQTGAVSQTLVVLQNFSDVAAATAFTASDHLRVKCAAY